MFCRVQPRASKEAYMKTYKQTGPRHCETKQRHKGSKDKRTHPLLPKPAIHQRWASGLVCVPSGIVVCVCVCVSSVCVWPCWTQESAWEMYICTGALGNIRRGESWSEKRKNGVLVFKAGQWKTYEVTTRWRDRRGETQCNAGFPGECLIQDHALKGVRRSH